MYALFDKIMQNVVRTGTLIVTDPRGLPHVYGDATGTPVRFQITSAAWARRISLNPDLRLGEAYMDGGLVMQQGGIHDALEILLRNLEGRKTPLPMRIMNGGRMLAKRVHQYNPAGRAKENVSHHYDLNGALYDMFLDRDRQYSCAYFETEKATLEDAQLAKKRHLAAKLGLKPGMKVLDIGSGWGGLGLYLAENCGVEVVGVTLSEEQHKLSRERAQQRGVAERADFRLLDYRAITERFDRIVSVGMFEHVGVVHYREFFRQCATLLKDDGVAVLHSINRADGPGATSGWIRKYIFPGGYIPALSEVVPHIEKAGFYITDIEILRLHYARTLKEWGRRFQASRERARGIYDERFCRMWEFYLASSELSFQHCYMNNFQIQFARSQHTMPCTRDYIHDEENRLRQLEQRQPRLRSVPAE